MEKKAVCSRLDRAYLSLIRGLATPWTYFLHLSLSSVILIDSSTESLVHVLMLSIQAVRGLPRLRTPGLVPCIISFSRHFSCFLMVWPWYASLCKTYIFTPALLRTHSFVYFAIHEARRIFLSPFISKASRCVSSFFLSVQLSQPYMATGHTSTSLGLSSLKLVCCDFSVFSPVMPQSPALCLTLSVRNSVVHSLSSVIRDKDMGTYSPVPVVHYE